MLRDELLRSKNDEIARCLLSRKRKLSELYFATVGYAGATGGAPADSLYQQKEQAFLDANDLSKDRYFNEATLPPFPDYATVIARRQEPHHASGIAEAVTEPTIEKQEATAGTPSPKVELVPSTDVQHAKLHVTESATQAGKSQTSTVPTQTNITELEPVSAVGFPSKVPSVSEVEVPSFKPISIKPPRSDNVPHAAAPGTPVSAQEQVAPESSLTPGQLRRSPKDPVRDVSASGRAAVRTLQAAEVPTTQRKQDKLPSLAVGAVAQPDQPLSPASSVEPYSNNTPIPPTASPDTSPGEEVVDAEDQIVEPPKRVDDTSAIRPETSVQKTRPTLVPTTPDEQLKLEEALSLQQNQQDILAASKTIGDRSQPGGNPLSNEVIKENVVSPRTLATLSVDQMDVSKDLSPLSLEKTTDATKPSTTTSTTGPGVSESVQTSAVIVQQAPAVTSVSSVNRKPSPATPAPVAQPPPERMTTRVSSGAIRHKSVSEILGETPKPSVTQVDKAFAESTRANSLNEFLLSEKRSPDPAARIKQRKERERERTKLSTVVFPKQQVERNEPLDLIRQNVGDLTAGLNDEQDYLFTLFQNKAYSSRSLNLSTLLASAHKTLSTSNHLLDYQEQMDCRSLRRIYSLQNANRWPLRQLKRSLEPSRQWTHWDVLLDHMKWMRTDFREERKWKIAAAKSCADWCAEYVNSDAEQRVQLRVVARVPSSKSKAMPTQEADMVSPSQEDSMDEMVPISHPTPDLIPSAEEDSLSEGFADEPRPDLHDTIAPAAIFSLGSDEFTFSMDMTPAAEKLLDELPIYTPVKMSPDNKMPLFRFQADADWKMEILPVSKYAVGRIRFRDDQPVRKRSRYDYEQYEGEMETDRIDVTPEQMNVALFRPENKHIRDRIHPGHSFRPPTEHPMPSVGFFESRQSSQWTIAEDDELRRLVKEYSYNWSLISSCLSSPSLFSSGAERRTPWECFERWIGLEGLPADMSKTQYFRAYHQRLETAQRTVLAQQQAAQQQQQQQQGQSGNNVQSQAPVRRRTTQPIRVDRRRASRHLALLDAMRKLAKKRETMLQKQQQATHLASLRKVNEANQPKPPISSPADFSKLKHERELKLQERQEQYRQQMIAQQRANLAAQRAGQVPNQQAVVNGVPGRTPNGMPPNGTAQAMPGPVPNGMPNGMPPGVGVNQGRPHPIQGMANGGPVNSPVPSNAMAMKMMPQPGMQQAIGARPGMPMQASPDNARVIREANRLQEQQRLLQSRQQAQPPQQQQFPNQQQFGQQGSHSPNVNVSNVNGNPNNPAMLAALQAAGGMPSPSFHNAAGQAVPSASPRMAQPNHLSSGVVPTISSIQNQIQRNNPNMSPEQVNKLATDRLHQFQQQQQRMSQVAMNAAAGNIGAVQSNFQIPHDGNFQANAQPGMANGAPAMQNSQTQGYSSMMRVPQPGQQTRVPVGNSPSMNGNALPSQQSRSATPQTQRSSSVQAGPVPGTSKSPHPPPAQMATN